VPRGPSAPKPATPSVPSPRLHLHDGSRTHAEARIAIAAEPDPEEGFATPTRRFTLAEITSGLPDDSREEDERAEARRLRELRGRVKAARAVVSTTPGLAGTLAANWRRAAEFYARFGVTESMFRSGVRSAEA